MTAALRTLVLNNRGTTNVTLNTNETAVTSAAELATAISTAEANSSTTYYAVCSGAIAVNTGLTIPANLLLRGVNGALITLTAPGSLKFAGKGLVNPTDPVALIKWDAGMGSMLLQDFNVNTSTDAIHADTAHPFVTGDLVRVVMDAGDTAPAGLTDESLYYAIKVDANKIKLATTYANAIAGTNIDITDQGSSGATGTIYAVPVAFSGSAFPNEIATEVIDTDSTSLTERLKVL